LFCRTPRESLGTLRAESQFLKPSTWENSFTCFSSAGSKLPHLDILVVGFVNNADQLIEERFFGGIDREWLAAKSMPADIWDSQSDTHGTMSLGGEDAARAHLEGHISNQATKLGFNMP